MGAARLVSSAHRASFLSLALILSLSPARLLSLSPPPLSLPLPATRKLQVLDDGGRRPSFRREERRRAGAAAQCLGGGAAGALPSAGSSGRGGGGGPVCQIRCPGSGGRGGEAVAPSPLPHLEGGEAEAAAQRRVGGSPAQRWIPLDATAGRRIPGAAAGRRLPAARRRGGPARSSARPSLLCDLFYTIIC